MDVAFRKGILLILALGLLHWGCGNRKTPVAVKSLQVADGFEISEAVSPDLIAYPMFATFDDRGRLFVFESIGTNNRGTAEMLAQPNYQIRLLEDLDDDGQFDRGSIYADSLPFPMGGTFFNGSLYVTASPDLIKFTDQNGDGVADQREIILTGWTFNQNGAILSGPFMGPDGWLYLADARRGFEIETKEGNVLQGKGARVWRCLPDGSRLEWLCGGGFDNSIEIVFQPSGETIGTMTYFTDPQDGERDAIMHWVEGGVYPKYNSVIDEDSLPLTGELMPVMTKMPRIAPSGLMRYQSGVWGPEYNGNLFSAEFNTGRIMRYRVFPDGSTFKTEQETFVKSTTSDIHLTDILEDADGSLLVLVTGGWFIEGCPLSQVAKPEVKGGIYRIRKTNQKSHALKDTWGKAIEFESLSIDELGHLVINAAYRVSQNALDALVKRGATSIPVLELSMEEALPETRSSIVFALYRIGGESALSTVRLALSDPDDQVKIAAARCLGLAKDVTSVEVLKLQMLNGSSAVRRQVASALGQIGDAGAIPALLASLRVPADRMAEHAVIFSLIQIGETHPLKSALKDTSAQIRRATAIALDQMKVSSLSDTDIIPFLSSRVETDRKTGIWIAARHPLWSQVIVGFLDSMLNQTELLAADQADLGGLLMTFSENSDVQTLIANRVKLSQLTHDRLFLLEIMKMSGISQFPKVWKDLLKGLLDDSNSEIRRTCLQLIESRRLEGFEHEINNMVHDPQLGDEIRMQALSARLITDQRLSTDEWIYLRELLGLDNESFIRQQAMQLISRSQPDDDQLLTLAKCEVPNAALYLLPKLMDAFSGSTNDQVGTAFINAMNQVTIGLENVSVPNLEKLLEAYSDSVRVEAEPLIRKIENKQNERLLKLDQLEASLEKGDVGEGRKIFFGKGICYTCHAVGSEGADFGPDLSNIGEIRSTHDLLEAIVYPSATFAREYETYKIKTGENDYLGVLVNQTDEAIVISISPGSEIRINRKDAISVDLDLVSMMPPGLDQQLSRTELADLLAFLKALPYDIERLIELKETQ
ncbi:MAG: HEAT repeat domain-containing protein [Saprospiraceae bacterium]|nr:HEAT repeat domain-containing protein [Saprospiraceae bacterium]